MKIFDYQKGSATKYCVQQERHPYELKSPPSIPSQGFLTLRSEFEDEDEDESEDTDQFEVVRKSHR